MVQPRNAMLQPMAIELLAYYHVGIRVRQRERALTFYGLLGFHEVAWHEGPRVSILRNAAGLEINLIVNANDAPDGPNVLMDVPGQKPAGYTHASFRVHSVRAAEQALREAGVTISEGPVELGGVELALFVRDPDANVIELSEPLVGDSTAAV
jgi:lactoylglutathione lyase